MAATFISSEKIPNYLALSTDISSNKIVGITTIGAIVYLTDTSAWKIVAADGTVVNYVIPKLQTA